MANRDPASNQLKDYHKKNGNAGSATTSSGNPVGEKDASLTVGKTGNILLEDWELLDELSHFARERIPERVVHAKGGGAFGKFEVTHDITRYTVATVFSKVGKVTPIGVRFSTVAGNLGAADTARDPRGFAVKFYTEDGIWDLVGNNTPIFFIRDPMMFPMFIHSQKRNPVTHLRDWDAFWDFISLRPETMHQVLILFSDRGIPDGFRHMHGYGSHTFTLVNKNQERTFCKFHYKTDQGIKNILADKADTLAGTDPDYAIRDLYNNIASGNFPSWTLYIQVMTEAQAASSPFDPFDVTKVWPHGDYPLLPVGKLTLDRNPENYFAEIEQIAFSPASMIPGIYASKDRMLLGRLFSYHDAHLYRVGTNYLQIPVNCPFTVRNFQRDGYNTINSQGGAPNYHPNSFGGPDNDKRARLYHPTSFLSGQIDRYDTRDEDNFTQATGLYNILNDDEKARLVSNIVGALRNADIPIQERNVVNFKQVNADFGKRIENGLKRKATASM